MDARGLRGAIVEAAHEKPFLGLCIGLQMLFERGEEGNSAGLGVLPGRVPPGFHEEGDRPFGVTEHDQLVGGPHHGVVAGVQGLQHGRQLRLGVGLLERQSQEPGDPLQSSFDGAGRRDGDVHRRYGARQKSTGMFLLVLGQVVHDQC